MNWIEMYAMLKIMIPVVLLGLCVVTMIGLVIYALVKDWIKNLKK